MVLKKIPHFIKKHFSSTDYSKLSLDAHKKHKGKLSIISKFPLKTKKDLSIAYTPGVACPCIKIHEDEKLYKTYTSSASTVAVISDGSAVLGLGNIGPYAAMPVMEGKCALFKAFAGVDAYPIVLASQDTEEIIQTIKTIAPSFGGINLEDISAPRCFEIEERLNKELPIPVFHDDQHGTAIVVLAGIINGLKLAKKKKENLKVVINGAGAAGIAITKLLHKFGVKEIIVCDSKRAISKKRKDLNSVKKSLLKFTNKKHKEGSLNDVLKNSDVFIGVSKGNLLGSKDVKIMNKDPFIFAMANPIPEIMPDEAKKGGAFLVATGRSDFSNQLNNVLVFPGIFKGAIKANICSITPEMNLAAAYALAAIVKKPTANKIIPSPFEKGVSDAVAKAVIKLAKKH